MENNIEIVRLKKQHIKQILNIETSQNIKILNEKIIYENISSTNTLYYGAIINNNLVGYICFSYILESCDIEAIVTHNKFTHKKIATTLLLLLFDFCKKNNILNIFLEVRKSNFKAINLYEKLGFKKIDERKNYYNNVEDALIYKKVIC